MLKNLITIIGSGGSDARFQNYQQAAGGGYGSDGYGGGGGQGASYGGGQQFASAVNTFAASSQSTGTGIDTSQSFPTLFVSLLNSSNRLRHVSIIRPSDCEHENSARRRMKMNSRYCTYCTVSGWTRVFLVIPIWPIVIFVLAVKNVKKEVIIWIGDLWGASELRNWDTNKQRGSDGLLCAQWHYARIASAHIHTYYFNHALLCSNNWPSYQTFPYFALLKLWTFWS